MIKARRPAGETWLLGKRSNFIVTVQHFGGENDGIFLIHFFSHDVFV